MTNEAGTIIDDGVACRFRDDHFYVTATTSGAERVYLSMLWWNAQWRLEVDISHVNAAYAAVNLAGPKAREVLAKITDGVDLSPEAFPYMGLREGHVGGVPARLIRIGFVGELGYELHVPMSQGEALWDAVMDAGRDHGLKPFGLEAQRVLRLEKGHIIIGQDTDAMTFPHEVDMAWAIAKKKPFFVGGRSIEQRLRQPMTRKLVGFIIEDLGEDAGGPAPDESNVVLRGGEVVGFVTSVTPLAGARQGDRPGLRASGRRRAWHYHPHQARQRPGGGRGRRLAAFLRSRKRAPGDVALWSPPTTSSRMPTRAAVFCIGSWPPPAPITAR